MAASENPTVHGLLSRSISLWDESFTTAKSIIDKNLGVLPETAGEEERVMRGRDVSLLAVPLYNDINQSIDFACRGNPVDIERFINVSAEMLMELRTRRRNG